MLILNKNILTIGGNRLEGGPLTPPEPPEPPGPSIEEVTIGTQTWMAKNLAIDDGGTGIITRNLGVVNGVDLGTQYYYTWDAAYRVAQTVGNGWRLPTKAEYDTLATYAGGTNYAGAKLKSINGWNDNGNGTDDYGFTALPVGMTNKYDDVYPAGGTAYFWTSTDYASYKYTIFFRSSDTNMRSTGNVKEARISVRLIKDN